MNATTYPAVLVISRPPTKATPDVYVMLDNRILNDAVEEMDRINAYLMSNAAYRTTGLYHYQAVPVAEAEEAAAKIRCELEAAARAKSEAGNAPTSPAPVIPEGTNPPQSTTKLNSGQATAVVGFLWDRMTPPDDTEIWLIPQRDTTVRINGGNTRPAKMKLDEILDLGGWAYGPMKMVCGNKRPGQHLYEMEMRQV